MCFASKQEGSSGGARRKSPIRTSDCNHRNYSRATHGRKPTAAELVAEMHKQYCIAGGDNNNATNDDEEMVETALSNFEGTCYHCGADDHRKAQCPLLKGKGGKNNRNHKGKGKKTKFKGDCNHCGKAGHKEKDCWEKHPEKKPAKYRKQGESSAANIEILVVNIGLPASVEMIEDMLGVDEGLMEAMECKIFIKIFSLGSDDDLK